MQTERTQGLETSQRICEAVSEYFSNLERADDAYHDVAQTHLSEFDGEHAQLVPDGGGPTGIHVVCQDCDFEATWYPGPDTADVHTHELATDHEVAYQSLSDAARPREQVIDEILEQRGDGELIVDGGEEVVGYINGHDVESRERTNRPLSDYYLCLRCGKTRNTTEEFQSFDCGRKLVADGGDT